MNSTEPSSVEVRTSQTRLLGSAGAPPSDLSRKGAGERQSGYVRPQRSGLKVKFWENHKQGETVWL